MISKRNIEKNNKIKINSLRKNQVIKKYLKKENDFHLNKRDI